MGTLTATPIGGLPEIVAGDDLAALILAAGPRPADGDVLVISQKVVSKAEGCVRELASIEASVTATELAAKLDKDPRHVQAILDESAAVVRAEHGVLIVRTHHGFVCANAGIDESNAPGEGLILLLPRDPDRSARALRARLRELSGRSPAVVISDSFGRAWRLGQLDTAIGCAGLKPLDDWRGRQDRRERTLNATLIAVADAIAGAAELTRAKDSGEPVVVVSGLEVTSRATTDPARGRCCARRTRTCSARSPADRRDYAAICPVFRRCGASEQSRRAHASQDHRLDVIPWRPRDWLGQEQENGGGLGMDQVASSRWTVTGCINCEKKSLMRSLGRRARPGSTPA